MPTFLLEVVKLTGLVTLEDRLEALLRPAIEPLGYELAGIEFHPSASGMLRVYIDSPDGVTIDDCAKASRQVSSVLDVEDPIPGAFTLEVSSPGVFRPLFNAGDYERFAGERVKVTLAQELDGRRRYRGVLLGIEGDNVLIQDGQEKYSVPRDMIAKANLDPQL